MALCGSYPMGSISPESGVITEVYWKNAEASFSGPRDIVIASGVVAGESIGSSFTLTDYKVFYNYEVSSDTDYYNPAFFANVGPLKINKGDGIFIGTRRIGTDGADEHNLALKYSMDTIPNCGTAVTVSCFTKTVLFKSNRLTHSTLLIKYTLGY